MKTFLLNIRSSMGRITLLAALGLSGTTPSTYGQSELPYRPSRIYDQFPVGENPSLLPWMSPVNIGSPFLPLGQVFVPEHGSMGFVELILNYESPLFRPGDSQTLLVSVHAGNSMEGPLVANSQPLSFNRSIDPQDPGFVEFAFPERVPLKPGMPYTLDVSYVAGDDILTLAIIPGGDHDTYPPGWMYMAGNPPPGTSWSVDLWFRTGTVIPEPSSAALLMVGGALLVAGRRRRKHLSSWPPRSRRVGASARTA